MNSSCEYGARPVVSVIVPSYNRGPVVFSTLEQIAPLVKAAGGELILVDQSGYDREKINKLWQLCEFKYIRLKLPGLPNARNRGAQTASNEILLFIDDDAVPHEAWIESHVRHYDDPGIGCVAGSVRDSNAPGKADVPVIFNEKNGIYYTDFGCEKMQETISVPGGNFSVRKSVWEQILFDTSYKSNAYFEEVDFAFRLRKSGWRILYEPQAVVEHRPAPAGGCRYRGIYEIYYRFRNYALFYFQHANIRYCPEYFKKEKNFVEYISRNGRGSHKASVVLIAALGILSGVFTGLRKRFS
jgi:GT2 family glycosyltransferase